MTGPTHMSVGIATSLLVLRPVSVPACLSTVFGGLIGASISDIDHPAGKTTEYSKNDVIHIIMWTIAILGIDYYCGDGINDYIGSHFGPLVWGGLAVFLITIIPNIRRDHQGFLHSFLAGIILTISVYSFCRPIAPAFGLGFFTHILLDYTNKNYQIMLICPPNKIKPLGLCPYNETENNVLGAIATMVSIYIGVYFFINTIVFSNVYENILIFFEKSVQVRGIDIPVYILYFIAVNLIAFIVNYINERAYKKKDIRQEAIDLDKYNLVIRQYVMTSDL